MSFLSILLFILLWLLVLARFLPRKMEIVVSTIINASKEKVWNYVKILDNQRFYSVRVMADPNVKLSQWWIDGTVWATQARESNDKNVGKGEQEITSIVEWTSYEVEIRFERPMKATNYAKTSLEELDVNHTKVSTSFRWDSPWPMNLMALFFKPKLTKEMQQNMDNLKKELEK